METRGGGVSFERVLFERSARAGRIRRRAAAGAGAAVFVGGLLIAAGLTSVLLIVFGLVGSVAAVHVARRHGALTAMSAGLESVARRLVSLMRRTRRTHTRDNEATMEIAAVASFPDQQTAHGLPQVLPGLQRRIRTALVEAPPQPPTAATVLEAQASRCNELGVALRRAGRAKQAATLHEAARLIFAGAGDGRGEALAANALGVALAEAGEPDSALEQFEQARTLLRTVGDTDWEGKVLANIGLAKHRVGRDDEAQDFLQSALDRLSPQSEAYRRVERRLKRAG